APPAPVAPPVPRAPPVPVAPPAPAPPIPNRPPIPAAPPAPVLPPDPAGVAPPDPVAPPRPVAPPSSSATHPPADSAAASASPTAIRDGAVGAFQRSVMFVVLPRMAGESRDRDEKRALRIHPRADAAS